MTQTGPSGATTPDGGDHSPARGAAATAAGGVNLRRLLFAGRVRRAGILAAGGLIILATLWYLQFSTPAICCGDYDGYYHIKWSRLLWEGGRDGHFPPAFVWLPHTTLNARDYVDHHFLFHVLQIPFTWFGDLRLGAKVAALAFASLALFSCYWLVVRYRISYPLVWLVALLACSNTFLFRINMTKAPSVSLVMLVAGIYLLFERRYRWLAPLAFLYVWTYSMFVMLAAAALTWAGVQWWSRRAVEWRPVAWTGAGILAGFVLNPYFPTNVKLFVDHVVMKLKVSDYATSVGGEWYPFTSWEFLNYCAVAFAATLIGYTAFNGADRRRAERPLFFLIFSTLLLIITARQRRWVEYWPPFAVLFAAFALQPLISGRAARRLSSGVLLRMVATVVLGGAMIVNVGRAAAEIRSSPGPDEYRGGMEWIRRNVPRGEIIFNTEWDDFPKLFYFDADHRYVSGLDPTYLLDEDPGRARLYESITLGREENSAALIREKFGARFVFTDQKKTTGPFYKKALESKSFTEVYDDEHCTVLRIE